MGERNTNCLEKKKKKEKIARQREGGRERAGEREIARETLSTNAAANKNNTNVV